MKNVFNMVNDFISGLGSVFIGIIPIAILWFVLTGTSVLGFDVVANLTTLVNSLVNGGFIGLVVLVILISLFNNK
tara:strand:+ start:518 stop:742 length:225 start_codon:yes stop_codon:yes gene_type:complete